MQVSNKRILRLIAVNLYFADSMTVLDGDVEEQPMAAGAESFLEDDFEGNRINIENTSDKQDCPNSSGNHANSSINSGTEDSPIKRGSRKRVRNEKDWTCNQRKRLKNSGQSYINIQGKYVEGKSVQPCECKCSFKCNSLFTNEERQKIHDEYWSSACYELQRNFIVRMVDIVDVKQRKTEAMTNRQHTRKYHFMKSNSKINVCGGFFLSTLDIGKRTVDTALKKQTMSGISLPDMRGRHAKHQISQEKVNVVKAHIISIPCMESHYCRSSSKRQYLPADLSVKKMYEAYKEEQEGEGLEPVKESFYRHIFRTSFNLSFHKPKKDQCRICEIYNNEQEKTEQQQRDFENHLEKKERARREKCVDVAGANESNQVLTFDLQSVLSTPSSEVSTLYYTRKLNVYNLTIFEMGTKDGYCYMWEEFNGKRGSCEIGTCIHKHITDLPPAVKHVIMYSDNCSGQNRNQYMCNAVLSALQEARVEIVDQKFLVTGHTQMEVDSMHSAIERCRKVTKVNIPNDWYNIMRSARRRNPYTVIPLEYSDFLDFKNCHQDKPNMKVDLEGKQVRWDSIVQLRYVRADKQHIFFKYDFDESHFRAIKLSKNTRSAKGMVPLAPPQLYKNQLPINKDKKKDLVGLCSKGIIPKEYTRYYTSLPCADSCPDRLPEPDLLDSSEDSD